jgi:monovalent cation/hydrogen antiporter
LLRPDGTPFPGRDIVIFLAFGVTATTLLLPGMTTEWLIRRLGLREDASLLAEDRLARITAVDAGLKALRGLATANNTPEEAAALGQVVAEYDLRLSALVAGGEPGSQARHRRHAQNRYTMAALKAERRAIDQLWRTNVITDEIHRPLQQLLDHEESMLSSTAEREPLPASPG